MVKMTKYQVGVVEITKPRIDPALTLDATMVESSVLLEIRVHVRIAPV